MQSFIISLNHDEYIIYSNTKENCLVSTLKYLNSHGFVILCMKRTARGNSHDENWQDEYTVINNGDSFSDYFKKVSERKQELYLDKPIINQIETLTDSYIMTWCKPFERYSGEESCRYIYARRGQEMRVYELREVYPEQIEIASYKQLPIWSKNINVRFLKITRVNNNTILEKCGSILKRKR